jgi:predicted DNA-binding transcriptional regulator
MDDRVLGGVILVGSLLGVACYFWLVFLSSWAMLVIQVSVFAAVAAVLWIVAWIGYTLATTPPPMPLDDVSEGLGEVGSETVVGGGEAEETEK